MGRLQDFKQSVADLSEFLVLAGILAPVAISSDFRAGRLRKRLLRRGYRTGDIYLPGLDIDISLEEHCFFRDDGEVPDLQEHVESLAHEFDFDPVDVSGLDGWHIHRMFTHGAWNWMYASTICKKELDELESLYIQGHEEAHMVDRMIGVHPILVELQNIGLRNSKAFNDISDRLISNEMLACVGGFIALRKQGLDQEYLERHPDFKKWYGDMFGSKNSGDVTAYY